MCKILRIRPSQDLVFLNLIFKESVTEQISYLPAGLKHTLKFFLDQ